MRMPPGSLAPRSGAAAHAAETGRSPGAARDAHAAESARNAGTARDAQAAGAAQNARAAGAARNALASTTAQNPQRARTERDPRPRHEPPLERELAVSTDVRTTVAFQQRGTHDPSQQERAGIIWRALRTPEGIATLALHIERTRVRAAAWGPGAAWALDQLPRLCGHDDDLDGFDASQHPLIAETHRRHPGLRLGATDLVFDALVSAIFEQKVTALQAFGGWRMILTWCGERAPGPTPLPMFAPPADWHLVPSWTWHRAGVEPPQSRTVVTAARRRPAIERGGDVTALRGIGPWTLAEMRIRAHGDPDAVSVGDYHLAHEVGFALTGSRVDDDGMLELLEPWRGHRQRVVRLIRASGVSEPRRGARVHPEDHRAR